MRKALAEAAYWWTMNSRAVVGFLLWFSNTLPILGVDGSHWPHGLEQPLTWASRETTLDAEYHYVMTAKLRLLFFWVGRDDVGGGYIRLRSSKESPVLESIDLKMGSDPNKAPRGINRWGAATEMVVHDSLESSGAFFGFWKAAKGESKEAVELELSQEESEASYLYEVAVDRIDSHDAASCVVPFLSSRDLSLHQLAEAQAMIFSRLEEGPGDSRVRYIEKSSDLKCDRNTGFLFTVKDLIGAALDGKKTPHSTCYIHNGRRYTMSLTSSETVRSKQVKYRLHSGSEVDSVYEGLLKTQFQVLNESSGGTTTFELFVGTSENLRGVPVQVVYQPNWWFKIILNLEEEKSILQVDEEMTTSEITGR